MIHPPPLKPGDKIAIVSIARKINPSEVEKAIQTFKSWGLKVALGENIYNVHNQFGGTDDERAADLQKMLDDPEINAVVSSRGGYGTSRIIDKVNFDSFLKNPKWLIGFSDITLLHQHINKAGVATLHATMPALFEKEGTEMSIETLQKALFGKNFSIPAPHHSFNLPGEAKGEVIGGNLSLLAHTIGSSSEVDFSGKILFLEDIDEYLYHIDRMMIQLKRAGKLKDLSGLAVGYFSDMRDNTVPFGKSAYEIIHEHMKEYQYPVAFNIPAGHEHPNYCIPFGVKSKLFVSTRESSLSFSFSAIL